MRVYTVHLQHRPPSPDRNAVVIAEGFCWPAFLVAPIWALANRMWFTAVGVVTAHVLLMLCAGLAGLDDGTALALIVGAAVIVGFCANDWRRTALEARGWQMAGLATAADGDAALRRFVDLHPDALNPPPPAPTY